MTIDDRLNAILGELVSGGLSLRQITGALEMKVINAALRQAGGNLSKAALLLRVHRNTLHNKVRANDSTSPRRPYVSYARGSIRRGGQP